MEFLTSIRLILGNQTFALISVSASFLLKLIIIIFTFKQQVHTKIAQRLRFLLLAILSVSIFSDINWMKVLLKDISLFTIDQNLSKFIGLFTWVLFGIQYQGLALFLEELVTRQCKLTIKQKICSTITALFILLSMVATFVCFNNLDLILFVAMVNRIATCYYTLILLPMSLFFIFCKIRIGQLPHILAKQLYLIIFCLIIPHLISDIVQFFPFIFEFSLTDNYTAAGLSALLLSLGLLYSSRKIMGLRFLNLSRYVYAPPKPDFVTHFKTILEKLSEVVSTYELQPIVQQFLQQALQISSEKSVLYLRPLEIPYELPEQIPGVHYHTHAEVEKFLNLGESATKKLMKKENILIYDEISFSHFYDQTAEHEKLLQFLDSINADIFLPLYYKNSLIAYIVVERHTRKKLYDSAERDEMLMFAGYLSSTINILYSRREEILVKNIANLENENIKLAKKIVEAEQILGTEKEKMREKIEYEKQILETMLEKEKVFFMEEKEKEERKFLKQKELLEKELYFRHQEMNQYRECLQSLLHKSLQPAGAIFYKNNRFVFGNQEAKDLLQVNPNVHVGHPLVKKLKQVAEQVADFKSPKTIVAKNDKGESLALTAVPYVEPGNVVITVSFGNIDLVKQKISFLKDPSRWDYLLYLETTNAGRLINELLPGDGNSLLHFKIDLLQTAISKEAVLLDLANEDLADVAAIIHEISLREELHILNLQGTIDTVAMATKLFGINPLFGTKKDESPLLELLNGRGTLFIKDIHLLNLECQDYLAEFIRYGMYRAYKSEEWKQGNVRIICSSNQDLQRLVNENKFSSFLFAELKKTILRMPSLSCLPEEELHALSEGFSQQIIVSSTCNNLLSLSEKDKENLYKLQPASFCELKNRVKQFVVQKAEKNNMQIETIIDPAHEINNPLLQHAARLGKFALKDKKIMTMLWEKFDKNQNKIAEFLGVNRSTVHRRCRMYKLT
ncbi:MAG: sigma 54-interacting transcriptional regulator [Candidatus Babeliales bacterium]